MFEWRRSESYLAYQGELTRLGEAIGVARGRYQVFVGVVSCTARLSDWDYQQRKERCDG